MKSERRNLPVEIHPLWSTEIPEALQTPGPNAVVPKIVAFPPSRDQTSAKLPGAVIVFPGGGYTGRAPHEAAPVAEWLAGLGLWAFVAEYRVSPYRHPAPLLDGQRAVRWVRHHAGTYGYDPNRVGILGFSAGGHLASTVATHFDGGNPVHYDEIERQNCRPDTVILCYAVISFIEHRHEGSMRALLGDDPPIRLRKELSNELQVTSSTPPTFLWHTAEDAGVPVEHSLLFAGALRKQGVPFSLHIYPYGAHGLGLARDTPLAGTWTDQCRQWLQSMDFFSD